MIRPAPTGSDRAHVWVLLALLAGAVAGGVLGVAARPEAWAPVLAATAAYLAVSAAGWPLRDRPAWWAVLVAVACVVPVLASEPLAWLAYQGASPWIQVATAGAAFTTLRRSPARVDVTIGSAALLLGMTGVVAVSVRVGIPVATAVLAASVPFLIGVLGATAVLLQHAREDRERPAPRLLRERADESVAHRALAAIMLRTELLADDASPPSMQQVALELRETARAGLAPASGAAGHARTSITVQVAQADAPAARVPDEVEQLSDREREVLKLVATGATNAEIARSLYLSEATVKQYVSRLMRTFGLDNRTRLALAAAPWVEGARSSLLGD